MQATNYRANRITSQLANTASREGQAATSACLGKGEVISISSGCHRIRAAVGTLWITDGASGQDYLLNGGEERTFECGKVLVIQALTDAKIDVRPC